MSGYYPNSWVYLVDVTGFILDHHDDAQITLPVVGDLMIPKEFGPVHLLLFQLSLLSRAAEERQRLLIDILPISIEVLCEWKRIYSFFLILN
jgi:hypothetical protein